MMMISLQLLIRQSGRCCVLAGEGGLLVQQAPRAYCLVCALVAFVLALPCLGSSPNTLFVHIVDILCIYQIGGGGRRPMELIYTLTMWML